MRRSEAGLARSRSLPPPRSSGSFRRQLASEGEDEEWGYFTVGTGFADDEEEEEDLVDERSSAASLSGGGVELKKPHRFASSRYGTCGACASRYPAGVSACGSMKSLSTAAVCAAASILPPPAELSGVVVAAGWAERSGSKQPALASVAWRAPGGSPQQKKAIFAGQQRAAAAAGKELLHHKGITNHHHHHHHVAAAAVTPQERHPAGDSAPDAPALATTTTTTTTTPKEAACVVEQATPSGGEVVLEERRPIEARVRKRRDDFCSSGGGGHKAPTSRWDVERWRVFSPKAGPLPPGDDAAELEAAPGFVLAPAFAPVVATRFFAAAGTVSFSMGSIRVVSTPFERFAQYELVVNLDGRRTGSAWRRYSAFRALVASVSAESAPRQIVRTLSAWADAQDAKRLFRCTHPNYLIQRYYHFEHVLREALFELETPDLILAFFEPDDDDGDVGGRSSVHHHPRCARLDSYYCTNSSSSNSKEGLSSCNFAELPPPRREYLPASDKDEAAAHRQSATAPAAPAKKPRHHAAQRHQQRKQHVGQQQPPSSHHADPTCSSTATATATATTRQSSSASASATDDDTIDKRATRHHPTARQSRGKSAQPIPAGPDPAANETASRTSSSAPSKSSSTRRRHRHFFASFLRLGPSPVASPQALRCH